MRKKLLALLMALVLMLALIPAAYADDTQYIYVDAGESIYEPLLEFENGTGYSCDLPGGLYLEEDGHAGQMGLVLCGRLNSPGTYDVRIYVDDMGTWSYRVVVSNPSPRPTEQPVGPVRQPPTISFTSRGQECRVGDTCSIRVEVSNPGGYDLYYSWYRDGAWYRDGGSSVNADTSRAGSSNYTCEVGYYVNGNYCCVTSGRIGVKVMMPHVLDYIYIYNNPDKTAYSVGENLNTDGLAIGLTYQDGDEQMITSGFTCSPTSFNAEGSQTVTVTYQGKTTSYKVKVQGPARPTGITVDRLPDKVQYSVGDSLDVTGLRINVTTGDGSKVIEALNNSSFSFDPVVLNTEGQLPVTVTYTDGKDQFTCRFDVLVKKSANPAESPSPSPGLSPSPSPSAGPDEVRPEGPNVLIVVLCAAAAVFLILFLVVLVMLIKNRKELEGRKFKEKMDAEREWRKNRKNGGRDS